MEKETHLLTEVLCGFRFDPSDSLWDSTYYGKFYEYLQGFGYTEKKEQPAYQIKFEVKNKEVTGSGGEDDEKKRMIFRNNKLNTAVVMSPNYIAFHKFAPYENWEDLLNNHITPGLNKYFELGIGKKLTQVVMTYLNRYTLPNELSLSEFFHFLPLIEKVKIGKEKGLFFQTQYELENNTVLNLKLTSTPNNDHVNAFLECSCIAINADPKNDWLLLANQVHEKNNEIFKLIDKKITDEK